MSDKHSDQNPLRVAFVDHAATPGGGQLGTLAVMQQAAQIVPTAVYFTDGPIAQQARAAAIDTHVLFPGEQFTSAHLLRAAFPLARLLRKLEVDVIVVTSMAVAKTVSVIPTPSVPRILWMREDLRRMRGRGLVSLSWFKGFLPAFDAFLANSRWTLGTLPHPFSDLPTGVAYPVSGIAGSENRPALEPFADREVRVATFSRPEAWKGLDLLVDALEQLVLTDPSKHVRLDLYGGGRVPPAYEAQLRRQVENASFPAVMHGHVDGAADEMRTTDVMVLPSRLPEPYGQVVAQGLHRGCVVVISGHGGATEQIIDGENGLWFAPDDADDLARVLARLWDESALPGRLSLAGQTSTAPLLDDVTVVTTEAEIARLTALAATRSSARVQRRIRALVTPAAVTEERAEGN